MGDDHVPTASGGAGYPSPVFRAFTVKTTRGRAREKVDKAVKDLLGASWTVANYGAEEATSRPSSRRER